MDNHYRDIQTPFREMKVPAFEMQLNWSLDDMTGYLQTWSAVQRYSNETGLDPVAAIAKELGDAWGGRDRTREIRWPLVLRVCKQD